MKKEERKSRIIARGEVSGHSHVITGDAIVRNSNGEILIDIGTEGAVIKHLIESAFVEEGREVWTKEHSDISLADLPEQVRHGDVMLELIENTRTYRYVPQISFDPLTERISRVED